MTNTIIFAIVSVLGVAFGYSLGYNAKQNIHEQEIQFLRDRLEKEVRENIYYDGMEHRIKTMEERFKAEDALYNDDPTNPQV